MIARAFPYDRPCRFQKFEATETILATGTTIWKPGLTLFTANCSYFRLYLISELIEGTGYESRRTSKDELFVLVYGMSHDREGAHNIKTASSE